MSEGTAADRLEQLVRHFAAAPPAVQTQALADYAARLPEPGTSESMHLVSECSPPIAIGVDVVDDAIRLRFQVAPETAMLRGLAGMFYDALDGAPAGEVASLQPDHIEPMIATLDAPSASCTQAVLTHVVERAAAMEATDS